MDFSMSSPLTDSLLSTIKICGNFEKKQIETTLKLSKFLINKIVEVNILKEV